MATLAEKPKKPDEIRFYPAPGGATRRNYTISESQSSVVISETMCEGKYANLFLKYTNLPELEFYGAGRYYVIAYPVGVDSLVEDMYETPYVRSSSATLSGLTLSASVSRSIFVGLGYASRWRYALGGLGLPLYFSEKIPDDAEEARALYIENAVFWALSTGFITIDGQLLPPALACGGGLS